MCFLPLCGVTDQGDIEEKREEVWWKLWDSNFPMVGAGAELSTSPLRSAPPRLSSDRRWNLNRIIVSGTKLHKL